MFLLLSYSQIDSHRTILLWLLHWGIFVNQLYRVENLFVEGHRHFLWLSGLRRLRGLRGLLLLYD